MKDITVVITNHQRPIQVMDCFSSCLEAGVKNLVVSSSGANGAVDLMHARMDREMPSIVIDSTREDRGCNEMWLRGVRHVKTKWTHILHDDDGLLPQFSTLPMYMRDGGVGFYLWRGVDSRDQNNIVCPFSEKIKPGIYSSWVVTRHLMQKDTRSISPIAGLFPTEFLIEVLEECEANLQATEFQYRPQMMVGNDLLIWLRAADKFPTFKYLTTPMVVYGHCDGSVTFEDTVVNSDKPSRLSPIYNSTRDYYRKSPFTITRKTKTAVFCYVPDPGYIGLNRFFQNMREYRTNTELIYLSDVECPQVTNLIPIPNLVIEANFKPITGHPDLSNPKGLIGTLAWMFSINIALERGIDHFLYLETDCRVTCDDWDKRMFDEYFAWKHGVPMCGGSPVCWHPFVHGYEWDKLVIEYAYEYQKASGMAMSFEGSPQKPCWLYPNGALQIINVKEVAELWPAQLSDPVRYVRELIPFDLALGVKMTEKLREETFKRMAWLACSYSGCKNHHVSEERRMAMIKNHEKVAVHEVKREDI